jgi:hypothetical protein
MSSLLIHKDDTKCIFDYDVLMHVRRFTNLKGLFMEHMPNVKEIHYYCNLLYVNEFFPSKEDFPNILFTYGHFTYTDELIDMLKDIGYDNPSIIVVELSKKEDVDLSE